MAVGIPKRYSTDICSGGLNPITWTLNIHELNYSGLVYDIDLFEEGVKLITKGNDDDPFFPIIASSVEVMVWVNSAAIDGFVNLITSSQEDTFFLSLEKEGVPYWRGVFLQDQIKHDDKRNCFPYRCTLTAVDGLTRLKDNTDTLPTPANGYFNHMAYIVQILNKGVPDALYQDWENYIGTSIKWYDESMPDLNNLLNTDPLVYTKTDAVGLVEKELQDQIYEGLNLYEALNRILITWGARIYMSRDVFYITQVRELPDIIEVNYYNKLYVSPVVPKMEIGADGQNNLNINIDISRVIDNPRAGNEISFYAGVKSVRVKYDGDGDKFLYYETNYNGQTLSTKPVLTQFSVTIDVLTYYRWIGPQGSSGTITHENIISISDGVSTYYYDNSSSSGVWTLTPSIYKVHKYFAYPDDDGAEMSYTFTTAKMPISGILSVSRNTIGLNFLLTLSYFSAEQTPKIDGINYQVDTASDSSVVITKNNPLLNDGQVWIPPESQVYDGTQWEVLKTWGRGAPPSAGSGDLYPLFYAKQILGILNEPRSKYYGRFIDDFDNLSLVYYDGIKYIFTRSELELSSGEWTLVLLQVDEVDVIVSNDDQDLPLGLIQSNKIDQLPFNGTPFDLMVTAKANNEGFSMEPVSRSGTVESSDLENHEFSNSEIELPMIITIPGAFNYSSVLIGYDLFIDFNQGGTRSVYVGFYVDGQPVPDLIEQVHDFSGSGQISGNWFYNDVPSGADMLITLYVYGDNGSVLGSVVPSTLFASGAGTPEAAAYQQIAATDSEIGVSVPMTTIDIDGTQLVDILPLTFDINKKDVITLINLYTPKSIDLVCNAKASIGDTVIQFKPHTKQIRRGSIVYLSWLKNR